MTMSLEFRVMQAGVESAEPRKFEVTEPNMTILELKSTCFEKEAVVENRKVRLIYMGRMLDDAQMVSECRFVEGQAIVHAVVSALPAELPGAVSAGAGITTEQGDPSSSKSRSSNAADSGKKESQHFIQVVLPVLGYLLFFVITGVALHLGLRKSPPMHGLMGTQSLFIGCSIWVYLFLCHGLPRISKAIWGSSSSAAEAVAIAAEVQ